MPKALYVSHDGTCRELDVANGVNLMQAAVSNGIYDIVGDCGGSASCATCHVYVDETFADKVPTANEREIGMLECVAAELKPNSRLCCQITMTPELDGIVVKVPDQQW